MQFLTDPIPHAEAVKLIADKPAVSREIFDQLAQEFKGRAMTITGIEEFDIMQSVQDKLATLPAGADWKKLRKQIAAEISPWLGEEEGLRRAKLLLNHHGRAAYAATNARVIHEQSDVFTYLMYRSSRTSKESRKSHQALDGMIFPTKHPFWATHTPPWEFGCNCMDPIPLTREDLEDQDPAKIADAAQLAALEGGNFVSGDGVINIQTPRQKSGGAAGYEWSWEDATLPYGEIKKRWTPDVAEAFEEWAGAQDVGGVSLLELLNPNYKKQVPKPKVAASLATEADAVDYYKNTLGVSSLLFSAGKAARTWGKKISGKKAALAHVAIAANEMERLITKYPGIKGRLRAFYATETKESRGLAHCNGPNPAMAIKTKEWDDFSWENIQGWEKKHGKRWGTERKGSQVRDNFRHELGHTLSTPKALADFDDLIQKEGWNLDWFKQNVSEYAGDKKTEAIAESFGLFTRENYQPGTLPASLEAYLENLTK